MGIKALRTIKNTLLQGESVISLARCMSDKDVTRFIEFLGDGFVRRERHGKDVYVIRHIHPWRKY